MINKFGRNYFLSIYDSSDNGDYGKLLTTIAIPFTLEFDIIRNYLSSANICSFRIYNLAERNRNLIAKDYQQTYLYKKIVLTAESGNTLPVIFSGNISQAWSVREGSNYITQIEAFDGGEVFNNDYVQMQFVTGTSYQNIIKSLIKTIPGIEVGKIGNTFNGSLNRGASFSGNPVKILSEISGEGFYIDNQVGNCLGDNEYLDDPYYEVTSNTGLLGTPVVENQYLRFNIVFEPSIKIGQLVKINSSTLKQHNREFKIIGIKHRGTISEAICGDAITTLEVVVYNETGTLGT